MTPASQSAPFDAWSPSLFAGEIGSRATTLSQVKMTLEKAGIQILNEESPEVRIKKK